MAFELVALSYREGYALSVTTARDSERHYDMWRPKRGRASVTEPGSAMGRHYSYICIDENALLKLLETDSSLTFQEATANDEHEMGTYLDNTLPLARCETWINEALVDLSSDNDMFRSETRQAILESAEDLIRRNRDDDSQLTLHPAFSSIAKAVETSRLRAAFEWIRPDRSPKLAALLIRAARTTLFEEHDSVTLRHVATSLVESWPTSAQSEDATELLVSYGERLDEMAEPGLAALIYSSVSPSVSTSSSVPLLLRLLEGHLRSTTEDLSASAGPVARRLLTLSPEGASAAFAIGRERREFAQRSARVIAEIGAELTAEAQWRLVSQLLALAVEFGDTELRWLRTGLQRVKGETPAQLDHVRLPGAQLSRVSLRRASLVSADLLSADLSESDLTEANLQQANLRGVSFRGAQLIGADLRQADLTGAKLQSADLRGARIDGTRLSEAEFDAQTRWPDGITLRIGEQRNSRDDTTR
jgi:Pentapeptide repeats (8 copies)